MSRLSAAEWLERARRVSMIVAAQTNLSGGLVLLARLAMNRPRDSGGSGRRRWLRRSVGSGVCHHS